MKQILLIMTLAITQLSHADLECYNNSNLVAYTSQSKKSVSLTVFSVKTSEKIRLDTVMCFECDASEINYFAQSKSGDEAIITGMSIDGKNFTGTLNLKRLKDKEEIISVSCENSN